jgi:hypothetical protein
MSWTFGWPEVDVRFKRSSLSRRYLDPRYLGPLYPIRRRLNLNIGPQRRLSRRQSPLASCGQPAAGFKGRLFRRLD